MSFLGDLFAPEQQQSKTPTLLQPAPAPPPRDPKNPDLIVTTPTHIGIRG